MIAWAYNSNILPLFIAAAVSFLLALLIWIKRSTLSTPTLSGLCLTLILWLLGYALELGSLNHQTLLLAIKIQYTGIILLPFTWLLFAARYTGYDQWLRSFVKLLLLIVPFTLLAAIWTNERYHLFFLQVSMARQMGLTQLHWQSGPGHYLETGYNWILYLLGVLLFLRALWQKPKVYRLQLLILFIATITPGLTIGFYLLNLIPQTCLNLQPFAYLLFSGLMSIDLFYFRFLDILPLARDVLAEHLPHPILITDLNNRVIDANPATEKMTGKHLSQLLFKPIMEALGEDISAYLYSKNTEELSSFSLILEGDEYIYQPEIIPVQNRKKVNVATLYLFHKISSQTLLK
jgi:PAS domain-containing protein